MRRRKTKYTWFPSLGTTLTSGAFSYRTSSQFLELLTPIADGEAPTVDNGGSICVPVIPDYSEIESVGSATDTDLTLRDYVEGQDYLLKRIVGKCFVSARGQSGNIYSAVVVTAGFFVARALDADSTAVGLNDDEIDPGAAQNVMQPWIWRRQWKLGVVGSDAYQASGEWPPNNALLGSALDGPHIDARVSRRVTKEHRLWFAATVLGIKPDSLSSTAVVTSDVQLDVRVLGALRRGKNTSSF